MKELKEAVEKLATEELTRANEKFPLFHSRHEGYAVISEEIEEVEYELRQVNIYQSKLWEATKCNQVDRYIPVMLREKALLLASEAIQVTAMCQKLIDSFKVE